MITLQALLHTPLAQAIGWALIHLTWQAGLVAVALALVTALIEKTTASLRYAIAWSALAATLLLPLATGTLIYTRLRDEARVAPPVTTTVAAAEATTPSIMIPAALHRVENDSENSWNVTFVTPSTLLALALPWIVVAWMLGVALLSSRVLLGFLHTSRLVKNATATEPRWQIAVRRISRSMGIPYAVRIVESAKVSVPTVIGLMKPVIVLPASALTGLSPEQFETILAHELAHIRRHDFVLNVIQITIETLLFYHPAVWWISRQVRVERENCCDDLAVAVCGDAVAYAHALTKLELLRAEAPQVALASTGGSLLSRIKRLLGRGEERWQLTPSFISGAVLVLGVAALVAVPLRVLANEGKAKKTGEKSSIEISVTAPAARAMNSHSDVPAAVADTVVADSDYDALVDSMVPEPPDAPELSELPEVPPAVAVAPVPPVAAHCPSEHTLPAVAPIAPVPPAAPAFAKLASLADFELPDINVDVPDIDVDVDVDSPVTFNLVNGNVSRHVRIEDPDKRVDFDHLNDGDRKLINDLGITDSYLRDLKSAGYDGITRRELASAKALGVTGDFARSMNASFGKKLTVRQLTRSHMFGVTSDYVRQMRATNYRDFSPEEMAKLHMMGVKPEGLRKLQSEGKKSLSTHDIIRQLMFGDTMAALARTRADLERNRAEMQRIPIVTRESIRRSMGITPEYEAEMKAAGMANLSEGELMQLRTAGVTADYVRSIEAAGFRHMTAQQLARLKMFGVDASYLSELSKSGYSNLSVDDLIKLRMHGIDAAFLRELRELKESDSRR